jgi:hypothetical protein
MSYELTQGTHPEGTTVKTFGGQTLHIWTENNSSEIPFKQFLDQAWRLLDKAEMADGDPRRIFLKAVPFLAEVDGWNDGKKKYEFSAYPDYTSCTEISYRDIESTFDEGTNPLAVGTSLLSLLDFLFVIDYVLNNTDIEKDDARVEFVYTLKLLSKLRNTADRCLEV